MTASSFVWWHRRDGQVWACRIRDCSYSTARHGHFWDVMELELFTCWGDVDERELRPMTEDEALPFRIAHLLRTSVGALGGGE